MFVNIWFGMQRSAADVVITRLRWDEESQGEYTGPVTDREHRLFRFMADQPNVQRLYKIATLGGNQWVLWTISFDEPGDILAIVKDELDALVLKYPTQVSVAGAWLWDGRQVGTQWVDESDQSLGVTGTPAYPIPPQLLKFMPDVGGLPATELADVNLSLGQSPRRFV